MKKAKYRIENGYYWENDKQKAKCDHWLSLNFDWNIKEVQTLSQNYIPLQRRLTLGNNELEKNIFTQELRVKRLKESSIDLKFKAFFYQSEKRFFLKDQHNNEWILSYGSFSFSGLTNDRLYNFFEVDSKTLEIVKTKDHEKRLERLNNELRKEYHFWYSETTKRINRAFPKIQILD